VTRPLVESNRFCNTI